jgi:dihydrofolate reductase
MGKIIISDNVSLDGVIQDPAGDEGFRLGGWAGRPAAREETAQILLDEALSTRALLFGRRSYEFFAARWPFRTGVLADRLNSLPKYVVSSTLQDPAWNNSTVLQGDAANEISQLKQQLTLSWSVRSAALYRARRSRATLPRPLRRSRHPVPDPACRCTRR